jgi:hypothetical protein
MSNDEIRINDKSLKQQLLSDGTVMLNGALQRNAKHEARLSNISDYFHVPN